MGVSQTSTQTASGGAHEGRGNMHIQMKDNQAGWCNSLVHLQCNTVPQSNQSSSYHVSSLVHIIARQSSLVCLYRSGMPSCWSSTASDSICRTHARS